MAKVKEPAVTITSTETVRLHIPGKHSGFAHYHQSALPSKEDLEEFVRLVHSKFGYREDVHITVGETGLSAFVTDAK